MERKREEIKRESEQFHVCVPQETDQRFLIRRGPLLVRKFNREVVDLRCVVSFDAETRRLTCARLHLSCSTTALVVALKRKRLAERTSPSTSRPPSSTWSCVWWTHRKNGCGERIANGGGPNACWELLKALKGRVLLAECNEPGCLWSSAKRHYFRSSAKDLFLDAHLDDGDGTANSANVVEFFMTGLSEYVQVKT